MDLLITTQTAATSTPTSATTSLLHTHTAFLRVAYPIASNSSGFLHYLEWEMKLLLLIWIMI